MKYKATFDPQVWVNDNAMSVDPLGPTAWDCTAFLTENNLTSAVDHDIDLTGHWLDRDDQLIEDENSPQWIREWTGPFTITVQHA